MKDDPKTKAIRGVVGSEPYREGEYPFAAFIGSVSDYDEITAIERREDYYGDHAILWFDVFAGDRLVKSLSAKYTAEVHYATEYGEAAA